LNGTLSDRGQLIDGAADRLHRLRGQLALHVLSADTFGTAEAIAADAQAQLSVIQTGADKRGYVEQLGADRCVAIGNGANDAPMLQVARLGIAVIGPEGAHAAALAAAAVICHSVLDALDLLLSPQALTATLRP
ncbi:MAG TPA: HAD hydrolase family protein, partial [Candidatus Limnocylindria bacterium]|nr:HAD hydrolase family protein [Candidatus Limnocylindria bacterium]